MTDAQREAWLADGGEIDEAGDAVWSQAQCDRIRAAEDPHAEIMRAQELLGIRRGGK